MVLLWKTLSYRAFTMWQNKLEKLKEVSPDQGVEIWNKDSGASCEQITNVAITIEQYMCELGDNALLWWSVAFPKIAKILTIAVKVGSWSLKYMCELGEKGILWWSDFIGSSQD